ncbi:MAG TPA: phospholipid carrier-dependent glycosyltransferase [Mycobacteriales bacterium]|nr:phospholipid carrier-dependent glycosyltransferase [Mycobacteriales bacterium]
MSMALPFTGAAASSPKAADALARIRARLVRPMPDDRLLGWLLPLAVTVLGGLVRFWQITRPGGHVLHSKSSIVFDETYYAHDSWSLLHHGVETNGLMNGSAFVVHPPLGKWLMALGEALFDHGKTVVFNSGSSAHPNMTIYPASPLSFRIIGAVVGTLAILILARTARRMFRSTGLGVVAGLLLALDGLEFVQSRTAMLDIYLMFWVVVAFACLVLDRDDGRRRLADRLDRPLAGDEWGPGLGFRKWRWLAGLCLGIACGTKWNGAYFVPGFLMLAFGWDLGMRRTAGSRSALWRGAWRSAGPLVGSFLVLPAATYVASWTGWFLSNGTYAYDHDKYTPGTHGWLAHDWAVLRGWWAYQREIYHFDATLHAGHPYLSRPWGWLLLDRPVAYYYETPHGCGATSCSQEVLGLGNPALWWASIGALVATAWTWIARRDWRGGAITLLFLWGWLPWVVQELQLVHTTPACTPAGDCHRTMFLFYMTPDLPFMALAVTMAVGMLMGTRAASLPRQAIGTTVAAAYLATVAVLFGYFYPILAARNISNDAWHNRMWFSQCSTDSHRNTHQENAPCWI